MSVQIEKGSILIYRVFDVAEEIDLGQIEKILKETKDPLRMKLSRSKSRPAIVIKNAPIEITIGEMTLEFSGKSFAIEAKAKIWDYGVISILFTLPIVTGTRWTELVAMSSQIESLTQIDHLAREQALKIQKLVEPSFKLEHDWDVFEDYVIFFFEKISGIDRPSELIEKADVAALILGESASVLSKKSNNFVKESFFQYSDDDLSIIDWNSAIVVEPSGNRDVTEVLEFALTHLMEMRYYDDLLDDKLKELYDVIEKSRGEFFKSRFGSLARDASTRYIEFSEFIERVDNSLKVVGDFYLATIFRGASVKFRIKDWQESITRKMNLLARVSELLQTEVHATRSFLLEMTVVILIAFEILSALLKFKN